MKKKAVAYIRVSTKSQAQMHSFDYQQEYWKEAVGNNAEYDFCGIYADNGISGKSIAKRPQFMQMIQDALNGKINVIFTKSVARFGRNTEELLTVVRQLRDNGVKVIFEKEQIDTLQPNSELFLTVAAAVAENDLRIYSRNLKWSFRERFSKGFIFIGSKMLGYRMNSETNTLEVIPEEAEKVKLIFKMYLSGIGLQTIAKNLIAQGIKNVLGKVQWDKCSVTYILKNEKYVGASLMQKTMSDLGYTKLNKGELRQFYMPNTHEAIITEEDFLRVKEIMTAKTPKVLIGAEQPVYAFSSLIQCGVCGGKFAHAIQNPSKPYKVAIWKCQVYDKQGKSKCDVTRIKDSVLKEKFIECYNEFVLKKYESNSVATLEEEVKVLMSQEQELNALRVNYLISIDDYNNEIKPIREKMKMLRAEINKNKTRSLTKQDLYEITEFQDEKVEKFIEKVTIHRNVVTFTFINGVQISRHYNNGQAGNQKGWKDKKKLKEEINGDNK